MKGVKLKPGQLIKIIDETKKLQNINHISVLKSIIRNRILRENAVIFNRCGGTLSPLHKHKALFCEMIIKMARIRNSLNSSKGLILINSLIENTEIECEYVNWKRKFSFISDESMMNRKVSLGYWNGFKKRNTNKLVSKKGAKNYLD